MSKSKGGSFKGHNAKTGPFAAIPTEKRKAAPLPPRVATRPKASSKGR